MWTALETESLCLQREPLNPCGRFTACFFAFHVVHCDRGTSAVQCLFYTFAAPAELPPNVFPSGVVQATTCGVTLLYAVVCTALFCAFGIELVILRCGFLLTPRVSVHFHSS